MRIKNNVESSLSLHTHSQLELHLLNYLCVVSVTLDAFFLLSLTNISLENPSTFSRCLIQSFWNVINGTSFCVRSCQSKWPETAPRSCPTCSHGVGPACLTHAGYRRGTTRAALLDSGKTCVSLRHHRFKSPPELDPPPRQLVDSIKPVNPLSSASSSNTALG